MESVSDYSNYVFAAYVFTALIFGALAIYVIGKFTYKKKSKK